MLYVGGWDGMGLLSLVICLLRAPSVPIVRIISISIKIIFTIPGAWDGFSKNWRADD